MAGMSFSFIPHKEVSLGKFSPWCQLLHFPPNIISGPYCLVCRHRHSVVGVASVQHVLYHTIAAARRKEIGKFFAHSSPKCIWKNSWLLWRDNQNEDDGKRREAMEVFGQARCHRLRVEVCSGRNWSSQTTLHKGILSGSRTMYFKLLCLFCDRYGDIKVIKCF